MDTKDFCNWFQGVLDFSKGKDGAVHLSSDQVTKIEERLKKALAPEIPAHMQQGGDSNTRC